MDKYDEQIEYLTQNPHVIPQQWAAAIGIFKWIGGDSYSGCLTFIRKYNDKRAFINGKYNAEITDAIRADERIPDDSWGLRPEDLPVFAEWHRKIDALQIGNHESNA